MIICWDFEQSYVHYKYIWKGGSGREQKMEDVTRRWQAEGKVVIAACNEAEEDNEVDDKKEKDKKLILNLGSG